MQMHIKILRSKGTTYYLRAFGVPKINLNFDYTQDFRDRLRKAQAYNRGSSVRRFHA